MSLVLYTNPMSRGRIAHWMVEETGAPYQTRWVRYGPEMNAPDYAAINPMRKVPVIEHNGTIVTECAAICLYLADAFPEADLAPLPDQRAAYYRAILFAAGPWEQATTMQALGINIPADKSAMAGFGDFDRTLNTLLSLVPEEGYLAGPKFTAADVYTGAQIGWGVQFGSIPKTPEVEAYLARIQSRRGFIRSSEISNAAAAQYGPG
ncbi:glutathione S-transferase family protein [Hyphomonas sp.]|uniref:glutathione S-transferase family protein n=1 Tax=Hyphomonas sp. TaxID=87 RepID=UPI00391A9330